MTITKRLMICLALGAAFPLPGIVGRAQCPATGACPPPGWQHPVEWQQITEAFDRDRGDTPLLLESYIAMNPASPRRQEARMLLGDWHFFHGEYGPASLAYGEVDPAALESHARATLRYRLGVSLLKSGMTPEGVACMRKLLRNRDYAVAVRFYLAYADYLAGDYDKARTAFEAVADELTPDMRGVWRNREYMPGGLETGYFLTQMDFLDGQYAKAADNGRMLLERQPIAEYLPEINRIVGESYFRLGKEKSAEGFLERYVTDPDVTHDPSAVYDYGVVLYNAGEWRRAEPFFASLAAENDALGQGASLYMGLCEMLAGNENAAAISFRNAYERAYDHKVAETAFYNYLTALTRGNSVPFSSSTDELEAFLRAYPDSEYAPTVEEYLATAYYNEKNYEKALASIGRIHNPSAKVTAARQKILYQLGMQRLANGNAAGAETCLSEAAAMSGCDGAIALQSRLWLGDALYQQGKYAAAQKCYEAFIAAEKGSANRTLALYDLAYSLYRQDLYGRAAKAFADALEARPSLPASLAADARIRRGDCLYYTADYSGAADSFTRAINAGAPEADYAVYRRAIVYGLMGDVSRKVKELERMPKDYPASKWLATAMLEKALTLQGADRFGDAAEAYRALAATYPDAPETRRGLLQLAMAYTTRGEGTAATPLLREIISRWPTSEEASLANTDLRRICADQGRLQEYADFIRSVPDAPAIDEDELEKIMFESAEIAYGRNGDTAQLKKYIAAYPGGSYAAAALLDLAIDARDKGNLQESLDYLGTLLQRRPDSPQSAEALLMTGQTCEALAAGEPAASSAQRTREALAAFRRLLERGDAEYVEDARRGIMRTTADPAERLRIANALREGASKDPVAGEEAEYYAALALSESGNAAEAERILKELCRNGYDSEYRAMGALLLADVYTSRGDSAKALALLEDFTDRGTPHDDLLAQGFLALADAYDRQGKTALARQYLEWLAGNYPGDNDALRARIHDQLSRLKK